MIRSLILIVAASTFTAGCAGRQQRADVPPATAAEEASAYPDLIARGCYRCLEQAFANARRRNAQQDAFEAAALLAVRSKELGVSHDEWLARARELAPADAPSQLYLQIVESIPPDRMSGDRNSMSDFSGRMQARNSVTAWRAALQSGTASDVFRAYLDVALVCAFGTLSETNQSFSGPLDPVTQSTVYQYRVGICDSSHAARLQDVRSREPDFVDADFTLGRYALEDPVNPNQEEGLARLESAAAAFPQSAAIVTTIGNVHRGWEEWSPALAAYDKALAISPDHPEALIGRTISLSHLSRSHEAIETATRVIDAGEWRLGEAYYWRGWNQLLLGNYRLARDDADRARTLMANAAVYVLSGVVEWRMGRRDNAEQEFEKALAIDLGECEAAFDLGVVRDELGKEAAALAAFKQAGQCYELSIALRRQAIATIMAGPGTDVAKAREAARHQTALEDLEARRQEVTRAIETLEKAAPHP